MVASCPSFPPLAHHCLLTPHPITIHCSFSSVACATILKFNSLVLSWTIELITGLSTQILVPTRSRHLLSHAVCEVSSRLCFCFQTCFLFYFVAIAPLPLPLLTKPAIMSSTCWVRVLLRHPRPVSLMLWLLTCLLKPPQVKSSFSSDCFGVGLSGSSVRLQLSHT